MSDPPCPEKQNLTELATEARRLYIRAARNLVNQSGTHFDLFYRDAEEARLIYETARAALKAHTQEHGC